jgi:hypothetical protein
MGKRNTHLRTTASNSKRKPDEVKDRSSLRNSYINLDQNILSPLVVFKSLNIKTHKTVLLHVSFIRFIRRKGDTSSEYKASNIRIISEYYIEHDVEGSSRYSRVYLEGHREATNTRRKSRSPGRDLDSEFREYKAGVPLR